MRPLVLYCKSYRTDLRRVVRLVQSVQKFNTEDIPLYISVPQSDFALFSENLKGLGVELLTDESILSASPRINRAQVMEMHGAQSQQVIKSEFWRLGLSEAYVCLDSDALFIRSFAVRDFLAPDGTPYTMIDEAHDLLEHAIRHGRHRIVDAFAYEANQLQSLFGRAGKRYSFGPFPVVWHRCVWQSLDTEYLAPQGLSIADAIQQAPIESRWYGEALLAYKAMPLWPTQALFKVYHYAWQFDRDQRSGIGPEQLAALYCGVIYQSAWEREMDWPREGGNWLSVNGRRLRRRLGRI